MSREPRRFPERYNLRDRKRKKRKTIFWRIILDIKYPVIFGTWWCDATLGFSFGYEARASPWWERRKSQPIHCTDGSKNYILPALWESRVVCKEGFEGVVPPLLEIWWFICFFGSTNISEWKGIGKLKQAGLQHAKVEGLENSTSHCCRREVFVNCDS